MYILEYHDEAGIDRVGPFDTRQQAQEWAEKRNIATWEIHELSSPNDGREH